jgi:hypothetical protein
MKYMDIQTSLYTVFASSEWDNEDIVTVPSNFTNNSELTEYIRINILASRPDPSYNNMNCISGQILIDIFTLAGDGLTRTMTIADTLDSYLQGKILEDIQLSTSSLSIVGRDRDNVNLHRAIYTIPFSRYGV